MGHFGHQLTLYGGVRRAEACQTRSTDANAKKQNTFKIIVVILHVLCTFTCTITSHIFLHIINVFPHVIHVQSYTVIML